jgi:hypothetical protein
MRKPLEKGARQESDEERQAVVRVDLRSQKS